MDFFKKHADTISVIGAIIASMIWMIAIIVSVLWMKGKFNELEKDIVVIKTVLVMKNIMPMELAQKKMHQDDDCGFIPFEKEIGG
jgi:hypothetical protein